jgi:hypothetical protein
MLRRSPIAFLVGAALGAVGRADLAERIGFWYGYRRAWLRAVPAHMSTWRVLLLARVASAALRFARWLRGRIERELGCSELEGLLAEIRRTGRAPGSDPGLN